MHEDINTLDRLRARSIEHHGCWQWTGCISPDGYGLISLGRRSAGDKRLRSVHRTAYEILVAAIPDGLQIDHLCRNRACWNPSHLDPVTPKVNTHRGLTAAAFNAIKTHCPQGHAYDEGNVQTWNNHRACRLCRRMKAGSVGIDQHLRTECPYGHPYDDENTYVVPKTGHRQCRACNKRRQDALKARRALAKKG